MRLANTHEMTTTTPSPTLGPAPDSPKGPRRPPASASTWEWPNGTTCAVARPSLPDGQMLEEIMSVDP
jgi:hypothetical protein